MGLSFRFKYFSGQRHKMSGKFNCHWVMGLSTERIRGILNAHHVNNRGSREEMVDRTVRYF